MKNRTKGVVKKVLLVAGGTGGHIWPAISFGEWLATSHPEVSVEYISGMRALEQDIYNAAGIVPHVIAVEGSPVGAPEGMRWKRWRDIVRGYSQTRAFMREVSPDLCIFFGGYVSVPALFASLAFGIPAIAHEQNAHAGRVTRLARRLKVPVATGWERCDPFKRGKFTYVGVPVRCLARESAKKARVDLGLNDDFLEGPVVAVMTGSLGSQPLQEKIRELSERQDFASWNFLVLAPGVKEPNKITDRLTLLPKRWDIAPLYAIADMLVVRGGASTLTEALVTDKPTIVVPWRRASDDHQMKNAQAFAEIAKARVWDETKENIDDLGKKIRILHQTYSGNAGDTDKRMYNAAENICRKLWDTALRAMKGEVHVEGRHSLH